LLITKNYSNSAFTNPAASDESTSHWHIASRKLATQRKWQAAAASAATNYHHCKRANYSNYASLTTTTTVHY
jgi:hypothetical protein